MRWLIVATAFIVSAMCVLIAKSGTPADVMALWPSALAQWLVAIVRDGALVTGWWIAAAGVGVWLTGWLPTGGGQHTLTRWVAALAIGSAALLLGGWYSAWLIGLERWVSLALLGVGWAGMIAYIAKHRGTIRSGARVPALPWWALWCAPAAALLAVAATVPPGLLWSPTEFGGYDALGYHLQLPKEWLAAGAMVETPHNTYGYLPSGLEVAFAHLMSIRGDAVSGAIACQVLHASFALLAAAAVGAIAYTVSRSAAAGWVAGAVYLAVPWTIVTGTLAYNEQAMIALGAAATLLIINGENRNAWLSGLFAGLLCGAAVMVKPTAAGMFVLPLALCVVTGGGRRAERGVQWVAGVVAAGAATAGWLARGMLWRGLAPPYIDGWQAEQVDRWNAVHMPSLSIGERIERLIDMVIAHDQFGYVVWPMAIVGAIWLMMQSAQRRMAVQLVVFTGAQLVFWLAATHLQSRFAVPMLVPACALIGWALAGGQSAGGTQSTKQFVPARQFAAALLIMVMTVVSVRLWLVQTGGVAAWVDQTELIAESRPLNQLPEGSRVYAEAYALPFYADVSIDYRTVWERSPLGDALEQGGPAGGVRWLREQGYTHIAIQFGMLDLWTSPGNYGYDSRITIDRLRLLLDHRTDGRGFERIGEPLAGGLVICRVPQ